MATFSMSIDAPAYGRIPPRLATRLSKIWSLRLVNLEGFTNDFKYRLQIHLQPCYQRHVPELSKLPPSPPLPPPPQFQHLLDSLTRSSDLPHHTSLRDQPKANQTTQLEAKCFISCCSDCRSKACRAHRILVPSVASSFVPPMRSHCQRKCSGQNIRTDMEVF